VLDKIQSMKVHNLRRNLLAVLVHAIENDEHRGQRDRMGRGISGHTRETGNAASTDGSGSRSRGLQFGSGDGQTDRTWLII